MYSSFVVASVVVAGLFQQAFASYYLPGVTPHTFEEEEPVGFRHPNLFYCQTHGWL